jgi:ureidoglycolate amidohydrolase
LSFPVLNIDAAGLQRQIDSLAAISEVPSPVVTRVLFSEADLQARAFVKKRCEELGLKIRDDLIGNIFARWEGSQPGLEAVATGSHIDAIPNAGRYDGIVGVLGGLEAFRALKLVGFRPRRSLELIIFTAEEPTRFGIGCLGSRLLAGTITEQKLSSLADRDGHNVEYWRGRANYQPATIAQLIETTCRAKNSYSAFIELHIEQGPILERESIDIGIVEKIAAPSTLRIQLTGEGGHAGAVLMPARHDALLAGAEIALEVEQAALNSGSPDAVATTGVFRIEPGAVNSVPCQAWLEIDVRDTQLASRDASLGRIQAAIPPICSRRGVRFESELLNADAPAACDPRLVEIATESCAALNLSWKKMISRAYHDSLFMAQVCPTTMIFIPCRGGVSHRPDEYSSPEQIAKGVRVLASSLARVAE